MKVAYLTSRPLGEKILKFLLEEQKRKGKNYVDVACIVTRSNEQMKPMDRWWHDQIKKIAKDENIPIVPINKILSFKPEMAFSVFYYDIIPQNILKNLKKGTTNLHFGYLPNAKYHDKRTKNTYRGRGVLSYAILEKEKYQAVTFHYITEKIDLGPVIDYAWNKIGKNTTVWHLQQQSEEKAFQIFKKWLPRFINSKSLVPTLPPANGKFRYLKAENLLKLKEVDIKSKAEDTSRVVRAFDFPNRESAYINLKTEGKNQKIYLKTPWQK